MQICDKQQACQWKILLFYFKSLTSCCYHDSQLRVIWIKTASLTIIALWLLLGYLRNLCKTPRYKALELPVTWLRGFSNYLVPLSEYFIGSGSTALLGRVMIYSSDIFFFFFFKTPNKQYDYTGWINVWALLEKEMETAACSSSFCTRADMRPCAAH